MNTEKFIELVSDIRLKIIEYKSKIIKQYFEIGKLIVKEQNDFPSKEELLLSLSKELGAGYAKAYLSDMRRLYEIYKKLPEQFEMAQNISWAHNRKLLNDDISTDLRKELLNVALSENISASGLKKELIKRQGERKLQEQGFKINIESIEIKNFKSIVDLKIEKPNPFTVFVGSNACGKSNIFSAIEMLFYAYYNSPRKSFDDNGGNKIFNFNHKDKNIDILINTGLKEKIRFINKVSEDEILRNKIEQPYSKKMLECFSYFYIGESSIIKKSVNTQLKPDGSNYKDTLKDILEDNPSKNAFMRKLKKTVPGIQAVSIEKNIIDGAYELYVEDENYPGEKIPETLISAGTKNMIILLTIILQNKEPKFICIEEPENGLHPLVLNPLVDTIRSICEEEGHYIWMTSHSPTIIRSLCRDELVIVDKSDDDGYTVVKKASDKSFDKYFHDDDLRLDDAWLTDIFEGGLPW